MPSTDSTEDSQQHHHQQQHNHYDRSSTNDDFIDQMLSSISSWPDLPQVNAKFPWDSASDKDRSGDDAYPANAYDDPTSLAMRLRQHQIGQKPMVLQLNQQQQQLMVPTMARTGETGLMPLSLGTGDSADSGLPADPSREAGDGNGYGIGQRAVGNQPRFTVPQNCGGSGAPPSTSATSGGGNSGGGAPPRQKVRARRGQATDPHSIAERLRRERIAERMKALQELVPNANKTDKASMLDEIIDYVKFLQLQVKVLSMSRLGGAAAVAPLMANMTSERPANDGGGAKQRGSSGGDGVAMTEHQVAKLMEEDMGSAMQYLQGKGLCLMPISLASAISTATNTSTRTSTTAPASGRYHRGEASNLLGPKNNPNSNGQGHSSVTAEGASTMSKDGSSTSKSDT